MELYPAELFPSESLAVSPATFGMLWSYFGPIGWCSPQPLPSFSWDEWAHLRGREDEMYACYLMLTANPHDDRARQTLVTMAVPIIRSAVYSQLRRAGHRGSYQDGEQFFQDVYVILLKMLEPKADVEKISQTIGTSVRQAAGLLDLCSVPRRDPERGVLTYSGDHPLANIDVVEGVEGNDWDPSIDLGELETRLLTWKIRRVSQRLTRNLLRNEYREKKPKTNHVFSEDSLASDGSPWDVFNEICETDEEQLIIDRLRAGHHQNEIAEELGCHPAAVSRTVGRLRKRYEIFLGRAIPSQE